MAQYIATVTTGLEAVGVEELEASFGIDSANVLAGLSTAHLRSSGFAFEDFAWPTLRARTPPRQRTCRSAGRGEHTALL